MEEKLPDMQGWTEQQVAEFLDQADLSQYEDEFELMENVIQSLVQKALTRLVETT